MWRTFQFLQGAIGDCRRGPPLRFAKLNGLFETGYRLHNMSVRRLTLNGLRVLQSVRSVEYKRIRLPLTPGNDSLSRVGDRLRKMIFVQPRNHLARPKMKELCQVKARRTDASFPPDILVDR